MIPKTYHGVAVDVCPECAGIWFDSGELGNLVQHDPEALLGMEAEFLPHPQPRMNASVRICPSCDTALQPFQYDHSSPVALDSCPQCWGIWVDDSELNQMLNWRSPSHLAKNPEQARAEAALAMAQLEIEHQNEMRRLDNLRSFFTLFGYRPLWGRRSWWW